MQVILRERLENLGDVGEVVDVKPGYARNYLIPQGLAYEATPGNVRRIEGERVQAQRRAADQITAARERAGTLESVSLTFNARAAQEGRLFGSITAADIAERLAEQGIEVDRRQIELEDPIKALGVFSVPIRLHAEVRPEIKVWVIKEEDPSRGAAGAPPTLSPGRMSVSPVAVGSLDVSTEVVRAVELLFDRKAEEVVLLDLRKLSSATDFFLIASGRSDTHVTAIADNLIDEMKQAGIRPAGIEGLRGGRWVLVDFVDFIVHVFHPAAREFYQLERLWGDAPLHELESTG